MRKELQRSCGKDYINATDLVSAHLQVLKYLESDQPSEFSNIGNEKGTSVLEVIESVRRVTGKEFQVVLVDRRPGDPAKLVGSSTKAKSMLGWETEYEDIDTIVSHAWKWHERKDY